MRVTKRAGMALAAAVVLSAALGAAPEWREWGFYIADDAEMKKTDFGYEIAAKDGMAKVMKKAEVPFTKKVTFTCKLKSPAQKGARNGAIIFTGHPKGASITTCSILLGGKKLYVSGANVKKSIKELPNLEMDQTFELRVTVDLAGKTVSMTANGETVTAPITGQVDQIAFYGYGANKTTTAFSEIEVSGE